MFDTQQPEKLPELHSSVLSAAIDKIDSLQQGESVIIDNVDSETFKALWDKYLNDIKSPRQGGTGRLQFSHPVLEEVLTVSDRRSPPLELPPRLPDINNDE